MSTPNGFTVYRGPSLLNGAPIVAVLTGIVRPSSNPKTGPMLQLWILPDDASTPLEHVRTGSDRSVCGTCPFASGRGCYVQVANAPGAVWRAVQANRYPMARAHDIRTACTGRHVRLGAYGDPAAIPLSVLRALTVHAAGWTGYTHQWRDARVEPYRHYLQASCESPQDVRRATAAGWGVFAVMPDDVAAHLADTYNDLPVMRCPASAELDTGATCVTCNRCNGARGVVVIIRPHGSKAAAVAAVSRRRTLPTLGGR